MDKLKHTAIQLGAFDSVIRSMLAVKDEVEVRKIHDYLVKLWDDIVKENTHHQIDEQLQASKKIAIDMLQNALRLSSVK